MLEKIRQEKGLSRAELAKKAQVSLRTLEDLASGRSSGKTIINAARLFAALGITPQEYVAAVEAAQNEEK
ncbi:MAG: helix-turn-helix transcriptional regulator [Clostridium sp.]|nr:helix-turn-helix transcriptional regulator [Clostridium sp.]